MGMPSFAAAWMMEVPGSASTSRPSILSLTGFTATGGGLATEDGSAMRRHPPRAASFISRLVVRAQGPELNQRPAGGGVVDQALPGADPVLELLPVLLD